MMMMMTLMMMMVELISPPGVLGLPEAEHCGAFYVKKKKPIDRSLLTTSIA